MHQPCLRYALCDGYIHNWLVAGPQCLPLGDSTLPPEWGGCPRRAVDREGRLGPDISHEPREGQPFVVAGPGESAEEFRWRAVRCAEDHLLDLTATCPGRHCLRAWAYTRLESAVPQRVRLILHALGPAEVWLNGCLVLRHEGSTPNLPNGRGADVDLAEGANGLIVWLGPHAAGGPRALAVQLVGADAISATLPSCTDQTEWRIGLERLMWAAYVERDLYAGEEKVAVRWPAGLRGLEKVTIRVQRPSGQIVAERDDFVAQASASQPMITGQEVVDGPYLVRLMPSLEQYYERDVRVERDLEVTLLHSRHAEAPIAPTKERAVEVLEHAARWTRGVYAEVAKMALEWWYWVEPQEIRSAIESVNGPDEDCSPTLLGLLHIAYRSVSHASFPAPLVEPLQQCLLDHDYADESTNPCAQGREEDLAILRHAASLLAGQLYPNRTFSRSGQLGRWHQERGERQAMAWLARRAYGGFAAWDSNEVFEACLVALVHLVDFAQSDAVRELATVVMDKLLFTLAANSFKGVFAATHGATSAAAITDGRGEPTSSVGRLLWGTGCLNQHAAAAVSLVCSAQYELPSLFQAIAIDQPQDLWSRERHIVAWDENDGVLVPASEVNLASYKTPDYMLSSAQDYRPGEPGCEEHIWQATLSPDAIVFVNHPACLSQKDAYCPNFWRGNSVLPRVAQWRDVLLALHRLPDDDWLGFTHAHFPLAAFDKFVLKGGWAFARKGSAYLALRASQELTLCDVGPGALRELRACGNECVWLCQMGRKAQDGSFAQFQRKILALPVNMAGLQASLTSLRGDRVEFGWTGSLVINGEAQPLTGFRHYESPYCTADLGTAKMEIKHGEWMLRLDLQTGKR